MSHERLFLEHLELIEAVIQQICRRHHAHDDEAEDFRSRAHMKLIEGDYRVLRSFKGHSSLRSFLIVVLEREFLDYRNAKWGKWRPSHEAVRQGEVAIRLECLTTRDRHTFDEAVEILWTNFRCTESREVLWAMCQRFPARIDRRPDAEKKLAYVPDPGPLPDEVIEALARAEEERQLYEALARALDRLEPEDRLIMKLQYFDGMKQVDIARALHLDAKRLYRRCEQILKQLKELLIADGLDVSRFDLSVK